MIYAYFSFAIILTVCVTVAYYYSSIVYGLALTSYLIARQNRERILQEISKHEKKFVHLEYGERK
jgi:predicted aminopeptidase